MLICVLLASLVNVVKHDQLLVQQTKTALKIYSIWFKQINIYKYNI